MSFANRTGLCAGILLALAALPCAARDLSFEDRVQYQRQIETVYWQHRIWPQDNPTPKPPMSELMTDAAIRAKVETYLKQSTALESIWQRPVSHEQLQAEIDRMVRDTRDGGMLAELFQALGNDPEIIAETLARQTLVDRLVRDWYASDTRFHGALGRRADAARAATRRVDDLASIGGEYQKRTYRRDGASVADPRSLQRPASRWDEDRARLERRFPERTLSAGRISPVEETREAFTITAIVSKDDDAIEVATVSWPKVSFDTWWSRERAALSVEVETSGGTYAIATPLAAGCVADSWVPIYSGAPDGRSFHTAVWTGSEMIVWGGLGQDDFATGGRYSPATDTWTPTATGPGLPTPRSHHTAVWTGTYMIVWGGLDTKTNAPPDVSLNTGGRYSPSTDTWLPVSVGATSSAPTARWDHTATWTGGLMIVWGGQGGGISGGRYNPSSDTWTPTSTGAGVPSARWEHTAVWTNTEVIIWGGYDGAQPLDTGSRYNPSSDTWTPVGPGAASPRRGHTAFWTGSQMIVWGGRDNVTALNTGSRYQPSNNLWSLMSSSPTPPTARYDHSYVWTVGKLIVWGGMDSSNSPLNTGGVWDSLNDVWTPTSTGANVPSARGRAPAVWTGSEMIVWGGSGNRTGGRYNPASNTWLATSTGSYVPSARAYHTAVWTGTEMIVWGGYGSTELNTGGRYNASTDVWTPTSLAAGLPTPRGLHTAVWTGTRMIVWGGSAGSAAVDTGARYDPSIDSWSATAISAAASARNFHTAVWTGSVMIVWGGQGTFTNPLNSGARYDPTTNTWAATSITNVPSPRLGHTAVWSGSEMIVWGGGDYGAGNLGLNTGGRYNPATNAWTTTSTGANVPSARFYHVAVWTGSEMIVWGGNGVVTGGRYTPGTNTWVATPTGPGVPAERALAEAVWTGTEMIVWGGYDLIEPVATGGRYNPAAATWAATSIGTNVPTPRDYHTAVWTGAATVIVWGGEPYTSTGALYCPTTCVSQSTYYLDADADGYGGSATSIQSCTMPTGYVASSTDCNDTNPNVNPGATEACDGVDLNCDGVGSTIIPGEINFGAISRIAGAWRYTWSGPPGVRFDSFRGVFIGAIGTGIEEYCLGNDTTSTTWDDDNGPAPGTFWWFLVRAVNGCGNGTLGFQTNHATPTTERISGACP